MAKLESELLEGSPKRPFFWRRFIDDVFFIWTEGEEGLLEFIERMNTFHNTIKFTVDWSYSRVNFLDTSIILTDSLVTTDLYTKPTDKHQYLRHSSCHPNSCKKGIPFGQALRIHRICSTDAFFEKRAGELCGYLMNRGYNKRQVLREIDRARRITREDTLRDKQSSKTSRIPLVV